MKVLFSNDALLDLRQISRFSRKRYGKRQATWYIQNIENHCELLASGRFRGRSADHISPGLRKQLAESHVIFYRVLRNTVVIVRILHAAMDHDAHL